MPETQVCRVDAVHNTEFGVFVDARHVARPSVEFRNVPLLAGFSGIIAMPKVEQKVVISVDDNGFEYVEGILTGPESGPTGLKENEFVLQFDTNTKITVKEDGSGGYDLGVDVSGDVTVNATKNILIEAGGDATVSATGNILLGDSANATPVAPLNHTHDYEDSTDTTSSTKTTSSPNESGTDTNIE